MGSHAVGMNRSMERIGQPRGLLTACLLLLAGEESAHGWVLGQRLEALRLDPRTPSALYKAMQALEESGLVTAVWSPGAHGPARRTYRLTEAGRRRLAECADEAASLVECLDQYLARAHRVQGQAVEWKRHDLAVDVWLTVQARDRASAWRKARRALGRLDRLDPDIALQGASRRPVGESGPAQEPTATAEGNGP